MQQDSTVSTLTLYRGFPTTNTFTWSAFVTKLEFTLRQGQCYYKLGHGDPRNAPSGKVPYVNLPDPQATDRSINIGDSDIILRLLRDKQHIPDLNAGLSAEQKALDLSLRALCEDKLYFLGMHERWLDNFYLHRDHIFQSKPWILRVLIGNMVHRKIVQTMHLQGCGRYTKEQRRMFQDEIWTTLEGLATQARKTGSKEGPFWTLGQNEPTEADAVVFAFVNSTLVCKSCPESTAFLKERCPQLIEYERRIRTSCFPDYEWEE